MVLRISSLIKVVSLLARTYGKKRRILGQPPKGFGVYRSELRDRPIRPGDRRVAPRGSQVDRAEAIRVLSGALPRSGTSSTDGGTPGAQDDAAR